MYRTVNAEFWTDPKVRQLGTDAKLLFLYLITNPHAHLSGLYYLPIELVQKETGLSRRGIDGAWKGLLALQIIDYDQDTEQVWVKRMFRYQGKGQKTERGVAYHLTSLHVSALIERFLEAYPQILPYLPPDRTRYPSDGASMGDPVFPSPSPSLLIKKEGTGEKTNGRDYREEAKVILEFLNQKSGKAFRAVPTNLSLIEARLKSGVDLQTCKSLIARKTRDWGTDPKMSPYLRPETLFGKTKFESYLAEVTP